MGGIGSGRSGQSRAGLLSVSGSGIPAAWKGASEAVLAEFDWLVDRLDSVVFSQDGPALTQLATLMVEQNRCFSVLDGLSVASDEYAMTMKSVLAIGRQTSALFRQFGMTPRDRQGLLRPAREGETDDGDELDDLVRGQGEDDE